MTLEIHHSNRTELLVEALAKRFANAPLPPTQAEHLVVEGQGMERWLALQLATRDGVFANPNFVYPRNIIAQAMDAVLGPDPHSAALALQRSAYDPEVLTWAVAQLLPALLPQPAFAPVRAYVADASFASRSFIALAERIARVFDDYVVFRHDMVLGWEDRPETTPEAGLELAENQRWQPILWRALVQHLGGQHMARRAEQFFAALAQGATLDSSFPRRLSLFGLSALAPLYLRILLALHQQVELHLFLVEPTAQFWSDLVSAREAITQARRKEQSPEALHLDQGHPLLSSLGQQGRDFRRVLDQISDQLRADSEYFAPPAGGSMLQQLQHDIFDLQARGPAAGDPICISEHDHSLSVHACHSPMREVEVLHDQLLRLFADDPQLLPSDVIVMAPQIETYAPFIDAVFGSAQGKTQIRYSLADRGLRPTHSLVDTFFQVLSCLQGRLSAPEVLALCEHAPVRERFALRSEDLPQLSDWLRQTGIRWGQDAAHRHSYGHPATGLNTWKFGLERLFVGFALPLDERQCFAGVLPFDDVEGQRATLLGKLAELSQTLFDFRQRVQAARPLQDWQDLLSELISAFLLTPELEQHQHNLLHDALGKLGDAALLAQHHQPLELDALRAQLESLLEQRRSSRGFVTGGVTFCSTIPMRAIPFQVIALLGLNDADFPRHAQAPGFDLMQSAPQAGDRSLRDSDRYVFLEALLSARRQLIISYVGQSIRDNSRQPPSVVVSELLDVCAASFCLPKALLPADQQDCAPGSPAMAQAVRDRLLLFHPLQAFSPRYFGADSDPRLWSYAGQAQMLAKALGGAKQPRPMLIDAPIPLDPELAANISLADLTLFFKNPSRAFIRRAMGLYLEQEQELLDEIEPIQLNGLEQWGLYDPILTGLGEGISVEQLRGAALASGKLPHGPFAETELDMHLPQVLGLHNLAHELRHGTPLADLEVGIDLGKTHLSGLLRGLWPSGQLVVQYSKNRGDHQLPLWIRHLALCAIEAPGYPRDSHLVARQSDHEAQATQLSFAPLSAAEARQELQQLVDIYLLGQHLPVPFFQRASWIYASLDAVCTDDYKPSTEAYKQFQGNDFTGDPGDLGDLYVSQIYTGIDPLEHDFCLLPRAVLANLKVPDFRALARTVYQNLLKAQSTGALDSASSKPSTTADPNPAAPRKAQTKASKGGDQ